MEAPRLMVFKTILREISLHWIMAWSHITSLMITSFLFKSIYKIIKWLTSSDHKEADGDNCYINQTHHIQPETKCSTGRNEKVPCPRVQILQYLQQMYSQYTVKTILK
jgi:hypothetical protein